MLSGAKASRGLAGFGLATVAAGAALQPFKTLFIWEVCQ
ncbi:hypothetical protein CSC32_1368 [Pseudomonas aeruginosa]|nr:hypothetical protein CSC32_1368 [Pseudomonas aeruginosa]